MYYGPESMKSEGMLAVEITENDRQQSQVVKCFSAEVHCHNLKACTQDSL